MSRSTKVFVIILQYQHSVSAPENDVDVSWSNVIFVIYLWGVQGILVSWNNVVYARKWCSLLSSSDANTAFQRQEAMEAARRRLQEQYDAQAACHAEEMKAVCFIALFITKFSF